MSDRVFKAIQESGKITGKKLDRLEANRLIREVTKNSNTSRRTRNNLYHEMDLASGKLTKEINSIDELTKNHHEAIKEISEQIDSIKDKNDPVRKDLQKKFLKLALDPEYNKLTDRKGELYQKVSDIEHSYFEKMKSQDHLDQERENRYYEYQDRKRRKERENQEYSEKPSTWKVNSSWDEYIDGLNEVERPNAFMDSLNDRIGEYSKKYKDRTPRKTKNSDKIFKDIENDYNKRTGKHFVMDSPGNNFYEPRTGEVHLDSTDPASAIHEVRHRDRAEDLKIGLSNRPKEFHYPKGVQDRLEYVREEEGDAFKTSFRKTFLNKHSGGRDWRSAHVNGLRSLGTYYAPFGQDINKTGFVDLSYNVPKELMEKIRENAKKKGIDLNKSQKINYKPATEDEAYNIRKYVYHNGRSNY